MIKVFCCNIIEYTLARGEVPCVPLPSYLKENEVMDRGDFPQSLKLTGDVSPIFANSED